MGTIYLILIAAGIGYVYDSNKPTQYDLVMDDGSSKEIIIDKSYSCPIQCKTDHIHHAKKCNTNCSKEHSEFYIHSYKEINKATTFSLNYNKKKNILSMSKVSAYKKNKNKSEKK